MCDKLSVTTKRLRELIEDHEKNGVTRAQIKEAIGCDLSTITKHYNGDREVNSSFIVKYANYFHVSADYLLGLSDVPTMNKDLKFVCDYTGLDEKAIQELHSFSVMSKSPDVKNLFQFHKRAINSFISTGGFLDLIEKMSAYNTHLKIATLTINSKAESMKIEYNKAKENLICDAPLSEPNLSLYNKEIKIDLFDMQETPRSFIHWFLAEPINEYNHAVSAFEKHRRINQKFNINTQLINYRDYLEQYEGEPNGDDQETE